VDITWPPGAPEGSLVVSTRDFELEYDWAPVRDTLRAGDAVTLTVRRKAADISAMLLPPLPLFETEGLAAYPDAPELSDRSNRGALIGERQDRLTWVVERAGEYRIPGIRFQWWDPGAERLRERIIGGLSFSARPDPAAQASPEDGARPAPGSSRWPAAIVTMALLLLGLAAWLARDPERRQRLLASLRDGWHRLRTILRDLRHRIMPPPRALLDRVNPGPRP
jgi:hypothetical protein